MNEKILLWIDYSFLHYGVAKYLKEKNFDIFGIIDGKQSTKKFFEKQKTINFNKIWNFSSNAFSEKIDLSYLKLIEEKYKINIWNIIYSDRYFYSKFNKYHKFTHDELLSLIQDECKFFEQILSEVKPKCVLMNTITHHYQHLFYKMCLSLGITVLTLEPTRFGNKWVILKGSIYDWKPENQIHTSDNHNFKTYEEIENFVKENRPAKFYYEKSKLTFKKSKFEKIKAFIEFFFFSSTLNNQKYSEYGRSKINILLKGTAIGHSLTRKRRESFIRKNFVENFIGNKQKQKNYKYYKQNSKFFRNNCNNIIRMGLGNFIF